MMKILYFTATGNCLYVAKEFGCERISIPQAVKTENYEFSDEKIGIVFPIYWLAVPFYVEEFLKKATLHSDYVFAVLTYGMMAGNAAGQLLQIAKKSNINLVYIKALKMVDNFLPNFAMEKQIEKEPKKQIDEHLKEIMSDVADGKIFLPKPSILGSLIGTSMKKKNVIATGITKAFLVEDTCVKCGICAKVCPTDNVTVENGKPKFGAHCLNCLACTQNCPKNAIRIKNEKSRARFRNQHITLEEITAANR